MATRSRKLESKFQTELKRELRAMFPGCYIFKLDSSEWQGIPDQLILFEDKWAILEVKRFEGADYQPNQEWYIEEFNRLSFSSVIHPENKEEVLSDLQQAFQPRRASRSSKRQ